ncbi:hypothetical protein V493_06655, partial [Pseudogymnoascus sp. VKM F-4281 (FW-2241)]
TDLPPEPPLSRANAHLFDALDSNTSNQLLLTAVQVLCSDAAVLARTTPARGEQYLAIAMELVTAFFAAEGEEISEPHVAANEIFKTTRKEMEKVRLEMEKAEEDRKKEEEEEVKKKRRKSKYGWMKEVEIDRKLEKERVAKEKADKAKEWADKQKAKREVEEEKRIRVMGVIG